MLEEILYADDYVFCMKTLIDSGQWNTLYHESIYGEKEGFSSDNPELKLKFLYGGFLLEYREEAYFAELAKYYVRRTAFCRTRVFPFTAPCYKAIVLNAVFAFLQ